MHLSIKKDIQKLQEKQQCSGKIKATVEHSCDHNWIPPVPSIPCLMIPDRQVDDDFSTTLDQFEKTRGTS